jgi:YD repeat-containing protein
VDAAKAAGRRLVPAHTMTTQYRYNTINAIVANKTPDAGVRNFWYDRLGRLAISQNAKQKDNASYGYTSYDNIGRVYEIGEVSSALPMTDAISMNATTLDNWMSNVHRSRREISRSTYDIAYPFFTTAFIGNNLRNRISWTARYNNEDSLNTGGHSSATFYSYDVLGNIDVLLQDYKEGEMAKAGYRFKKIAYNYDLASGKVNQVAYQPGSADAFYHRYTYDAENRITNVETSHDSLYWENEAQYQYYKHTPLARAIIGHQQVQGIDYIYTIQGWLKGVNSISLTSNNDPGKDGITGSVIPGDLYGFALHYFGDADYKSIKGGQEMFASPVNAFKPLYNANIGAISQHIAGIGNPLLYNYHYDALNRIKGMQVYDGLNVQTNSWEGNALDDFKEAVNYDANGNILSYNRNGNHKFSGSPVGMDSLTYHYKQGSNKLDWIDDAVSSSNYKADVDQQEAANYAYDSIGNLVKDKSAGIKNISWNIYGNIAEIIKENNDTIRYTYDVSGNRITKHSGDITTWYVRDAAGNIVATYIRKGDAPVVCSGVDIYGQYRLGIFLV